MFLDQYSLIKIVILFLIFMHINFLFVLNLLDIPIIVHIPKTVSDPSP